MSRDCIGFNDGIVNDECKSCLQCVIIQICIMNDRLQYRCSKCNKRTTATFTDPRVSKRLCLECYNKKDGEKHKGAS